MVPQAHKCMYNIYIMESAKKKRKYSTGKLYMSLERGGI